MDVKFDKILSDRKIEMTAAPDIFSECDDVVEETRDGWDACCAGLVGIWDSSSSGIPGILSDGRTGLLMPYSPGVS